MLFVMIVMTLSAVDATGAAPVRPQLRVAPPWTVVVGPGEMRVGNRHVRISLPVRLKILPPAVVRVRDEKHAALPLFNNNTGGWLKGLKLNALVTEECTATGLLHPDSVRVKRGPGDGAAFTAGKDYDFDGFWATIGRLPGGAIGVDTPVYVDYDYTPARLDRIAADRKGHVIYIPGTPGTSPLLPPPLPPGAIAIANVWIPGPLDALGEENLFPIDAPDSRNAPARAPSGSVAAKLLPRTLAKLRAGDDVNIVAWGDSVTAGGGVGNEPALWYQNQFAQALQKRFPKSKIHLYTAGWGGQSSRGYLDAPPGGQYNFQHDVIDRKPDLVTVEFVNDAYLSEDATQTEYTEILNLLTGAGAEMALITPHLVRPDWMGVKSLKFDQDPRPYVKGLRRFAAAHHVALADASLRWTHLWREGIPYVTLLANSINHPDARGHKIFADTLLGLFPKN